MAYALVQCDIAPPTIQQVREALKRTIDAGLPVVPADAPGIVNDSYGVLVERLTAEQARALRAAFAAVGYATEVVDERDLFEPPPAKGCNKIEVAEEGLVVYDLYGTGLIVAWDRVLIVAAGMIQTTRTQRSFELVHTPFVQARDVEVVSKALCDCHARLDILTDAQPQRITADGHRLNYAHLGHRRTQSSTINFMTLLRDIAAKATMAEFSRGFAAFIEPGNQVPVYPMKRCFEEELGWLVWHATRS